MKDYHAFAFHVLSYNLSCFGGTTYIKDYHLLLFHVLSCNLFEIFMHYKDRLMYQYFSILINFLLSIKQIYIILVPNNYPIASIPTAHYTNSEVIKRVSVHKGIYQLPHGPVAKQRFSKQNTKCSRVK